MEAANIFKNAKNILVLELDYNPDRKFVLRQLENMIELFPWTEVHIVERRGKSIFWQLCKLARKFKSQRFDSICVGYLGTPLLLLAVNCLGMRLVLLDEGVSSLFHAPKLTQGYTLNCRRPLRYKLMGLETSKKVSLEWVTCFDLETNVCVSRHSFSYLLEKFNHTNARVERDIVFLLGMPIERSMISGGYNILLKEIKRLYQGKKIIYFPHRMESVSSIKAFVEEYEFEIYSSAYSAALIIDFKASMPKSNRTPRGD